MVILKFIADGMLGKLTRWLRMIGCDVKYFNDLDDEELINISIEENRILLTRDVELFRRALLRGAEAFLVMGRNEVEKLAEVGRRFNLNLQVDVENSRCPKCNAKIRPVSKDKIKGKVPPGTFRSYDEFWECPRCGQIYWHGSHWQKITHTLQEARKRMMKITNRSDEIKH